MLEKMTLCEDVFHTASGVAFADFIADSHRETWPIRSKRFRTWLRRCYYRATGAPPSTAAVASALDLLEARAQFDAPERAVSIRVAEHAGHIYFDLADEGWRAVEIGPDGWRVIEVSASAVPSIPGYVAAAVYCTGLSNPSPQAPSDESAWQGALAIANDGRPQTKCVTALLGRSCQLQFAGEAQFAGERIPLADLRRAR